MDRPPYYLCHSVSFWLISLFFWTTEIRTAVYVAMGVHIILLDDSTKLYKLATFSCKLREQKSWALLTEYSTKQQESLPCASVLFVPCSLAYSLLGKEIYNIFMSVIALDSINLLFSVMGYACTCQDAAGYNLASPTLACCSQQHDGGATYNSVSIQVRSDCQLSNWKVTDMMTMNSAIMWLMINNLRLVAPARMVS